MALTDLLVAYDDTPAAQAALRYALDLKREHNCVLSGAFVHPPAGVAPHMRRWIGENIISEMEQAEREAARSREDGFFKIVTAADIARDEVDWIVETGEPGATLARIGRFHDLLVVGQFVRAIAGEQGALEPEDLVQKSGRPIVVVPSTYESTPSRDLAMLAWDGSRSSARALADTLQFLRPQQRLDVVAVETGRARDHYAPMPERDIIVHLQRHGVDARLVTIEAPANRVGHALLDHCEVVRPDLLVIGAYGRAKFGSHMFGNVTRHILENMTVPVVVSR
ncbi:MAG: universal stress protein [Pseudomonadota bacterium]